MAIKPVAKEFIEYVPQLIKMGLLKADMSHSGRAVENAMGEFQTLMRKPFFREAMEKARQSGFASNIDRVPVERPTLDPESVLGRAIVNYQTDRSDKGLIDMLLGTSTDVLNESGTKFSPTHQDLGLGWMSMGKDKGLGTAQKAHRNAQLLAEANQSDVLANSTVMGDTSSYFATPVSELMLARVRDMDMPKGLLDAFDQKMREVKPDWVGIRSQDARNQLTGKGGFSMEGAGAERKRFLEVLKMPEFRKAGFPQPHTALDVVDNPEYANMPTGVSGVNMWTPDVGLPSLRQEGVHASYSHGMPSKEYLGQFEAPVSWEAMNPRALRELSTEMTKGKKGPMPYTREQMINANQTRLAGNKGTIQIADQEWLDSVTNAIEHNKQLIAKYGSIPMALAAGEVLADEGDPVGDLRASEAQWDMSPQDRAIADLRASEADSRDPNFNVAMAYQDADDLWRNTGQTFKNMGAPSGLVDFLTPTFESSRDRAMGDDSAMTTVFSVLEKLDPTAYAGLLGALMRRGK